MTAYTKNSTITVDDIDLGSVGVYDYTSVGAGPGSYITTGSAGISWDDITNNMKLDSVTVKETATFDGDVIIKGKSLFETLQWIEDRLQILRPAPEIESQWSELAELRERYMQVEKDIREKLAIIDILKKS